MYFRGSVTGQYMLSLVKLSERSCKNVEDNTVDELQLETWHGTWCETHPCDYNNPPGNVRFVGSTNNNATILPQGDDNQVKPSRCENYALVVRMYGFPLDRGNGKIIYEKDYPAEKRILGCALIEWLS